MKSRYSSSKFKSHLTLMKEDARPRQHSRRERFNGLRWLARIGSAQRFHPHDLPPWHAVY